MTRCSACPTTRRATCHSAAGETAILFVDMQRAWVEPGRDPHVDPQAAGYFYERVQNQVIPNQQRLLRAMRAVDENVLHTVIESLTADGRDRSLDHKLSEMHLPKRAARTPG